MTGKKSYLVKYDRNMTTDLTHFSPLSAKYDHFSFLGYISTIYPQKGNMVIFDRDGHISAISGHIRSNHIKTIRQNLSYIVIFAVKTLQRIEKPTLSRCNIDSVIICILWCNYVEHHHTFGFSIFCIVRRIRLPIQSSDPLLHDQIYLKETHFFNDLNESHHAIHENTWKIMHFLIHRQSAGRSKKFKICLRLENRWKCATYFGIKRIFLSILIFFCENWINAIGSRKRLSAQATFQNKNTPFSNLKSFLKIVKNWKKFQFFSKMF